MDIEKINIRQKELFNRQKDIIIVIIADSFKSKINQLTTNIAQSRTTTIDTQTQLETYGVQAIANTTRAHDSVDRFEKSKLGYCNMYSRY